MHWPFIVRLESLFSVQGENEPFLCSGSGCVRYCSDPLVLTGIIAVLNDTHPSSLFQNTETSCNLSKGPDPYPIVE